MRGSPRAAAAALLVAVLAGSCQGGEHGVIRLATSRAELAGYVDLFSRDEPGYKVELIYSADPRVELRERVPPDIVVGERLACRDTLVRFDPLDDLFRRGGLRRDSFYPGSLETGIADGRQRTLPVSFNLPTVVFKDNPSLGLSNGIVLEYTDLRAKGAEYNRKSGGRYTRVGFSPLWNASFLTTVAMLGPPAYEGNQDCRIVWRNAELTAYVGLLRSWVNDVNGGGAAQQEFEDRYLYEPFTEILRQERILFYYVSSEDLFELSSSRLEGIDFRWLSVQDRVPVLSGGVSIGIPREARHKAAARSFLRWFFRAETQQAILAESSGGQTRGAAFGIAGGLSSLPEVNERAIAKSHSILIGHIPTPEFLRFPEPLPADWEDIRDAVVCPWLEEKVKAEGATGENLAQELTQYLKSGIEQLRQD